MYTVIIVYDILGHTFVSTKIIEMGSVTMRK